MELVPRLRLMNWLVSQGLTGLSENELVRGFCERCCAEGIPLSYGLVVIDTLHPIFEGRGFRWNDVESNQPQTFEFGPTERATPPKVGGVRSSTTCSNRVRHRVVDLTDIDLHRYSRFDELAASGHKHATAFVHRFGEAGTMDRWTASIPTGRRGGCLRRRASRRCATSCRCWGLPSSRRRRPITRTLGRVYLGRRPRQVARKKCRAASPKITTVLWFSDLRGSTAISEKMEPGEIIPFLNDYAQASMTRSTMPAARC
jgi:adenylate cyclase